MSFLTTKIQKNNSKDTVENLLCYMYGMSKGIKETYMMFCKLIQCITF